MKVEALNKFYKDIDKIRDKKLLNEIKEVILLIETASTLKSLKSVKQLTGYKNYYRIKLGDYRLGIYSNSDTVLLTRFMHRKDIYKVFP